MWPGMPVLRLDEKDAAFVAGSGTSLLTMLFDLRGQRMIVEASIVVNKNVQA